MSCCKINTRFFLKRPSIKDVRKNLQLFDPFPLCPLYTLLLFLANTSHVATICNFDPNYSLPNVTQVSLPKMFQIVATWLVFSMEE